MAFITLKTVVFPKKLYLRNFLLTNKRTYLIIFFFVINGFIDFGTNFVSKKNHNNYVLLPFFFFVYLSPSLINERAHTTSFEEGAIEHIFRAKIWLHVFDSVFWQLLIEVFVAL